MGRNILITGGAGFIGSNTANYFLQKGNTVTIFDNFSRPGSRINLNWLNKNHTHIKVIEGDVRDAAFLEKSIQKQDVIIHLAGQVAVTTSIENPRHDFETNLLGTLNLLEAARHSSNKPLILYSSTNKVYGDLKDLKVTETATRYILKNFPKGIRENMPLDLYSPYGCSKGSADQYVHDYHRIFNLNTVVFRQSCIYGPRQFGIEDQGWLAWFIIAILNGKTPTIFGDGKQVRDVLFIDDLIKAYDLAIENINIANGQIYNIGGGVQNSVSIWYDIHPILEDLFGKTLEVTFEQSRRGDQKYFVSDNTKIKKQLGWKPETSYKKGVKLLYNWIIDNQEIIKSVIK